MQRWYNKLTWPQLILLWLVDALMIFVGFGTEDGAVALSAMAVAVLLIFLALGHKEGDA